MVLEAERHGCVREVLVIAAALSIQDPRERPAEHRGAADELHRRFDVPGSDFLSLVKLWDHLREQQQELGSSQFRKLCRSRVPQLPARARVAGPVQPAAPGGRPDRHPSGSHGSDAGHPDRVHQALLAGLLSHLGMRDGTGPRRVHAARTVRSSSIGHGSALAKSLPQWVIAAELVETNRLWGRVVAAVQPEWAEQLGAHLAKHSLRRAVVGRPPRRGRVQRAGHRCIGLPIVSNRTIGYDRVEPRRRPASCSSATRWWRATGPPHHEVLASATSGSSTTSRAGASGCAAPTSSTATPCSPSTTGGWARTW